MSFSCVRGVIIVNYCFLTEETSEQVLRYFSTEYERHLNYSLSSLIVIVNKGPPKS